MSDYITVVSVDNGANAAQQRPLPIGRSTSVEEIVHNGDHSQFVTVLSINDSAQSSHVSNETNSKASEGKPIAVEEVIVYRLPGERLGFGLKFQGGTRNAEKIQKLFIQSCAADSPASRATTSWGNLREGDEIVEIDGTHVTNLTRLECVCCLKESSLAIRLLVRNGEGRAFVGNSSLEGGDKNTTDKPATNGVPPKPPPVPPRKISKRKGNTMLAKTKPTSAAKPSPATETSKNQIISNDKPFTPPPDSEFYINLFSDEIDAILNASDESDDTASTISTVVDSFSIHSTNDLGKITSSTSPNTPSSSARDLANALKSFARLEQEFTVVAESQPVVKPTAKLEECLIQLQPPKSFQDDSKPMQVNAAETKDYENIVVKPKEISSTYENVKVTSHLISTSYENVDLKKETPPTPKPRSPSSIGHKTPPPSLIPVPRTKAPVAASKSNPIESPSESRETMVDKLAADKKETELPRLIKFVPKVVSTTPTNNHEYQIKNNNNNNNNTYNMNHNNNKVSLADSFTIKKCIKVSSAADERYMDDSSSDEDEEKSYAMNGQLDVRHHRGGGGGAGGSGGGGEDSSTDTQTSDEDGEKLGPPGLLDGPGSSEAYFNFHWSSIMLPTIGEVEEEFSSLELQQQSNGTCHHNKPNIVHIEPKSKPNPNPVAAKMDRLNNNNNHTISTITVSTQSTTEPDKNDSAVVVVASAPTTLPSNESSIAPVTTTTTAVVVVVVPPNTSTGKRQSISTASAADKVSTNIQLSPSHRISQQPTSAVHHSNDSASRKEVKCAADAVDSSDPAAIALADHQVVAPTVTHLKVNGTHTRTADFAGTQPAAPSNVSDVNYSQTTYHSAAITTIPSFLALNSLSHNKTIKQTIDQGGEDEHIQPAALVADPTGSTATAPQMRVDRDQQPLVDEPTNFSSATQKIDSQVATQYALENAGRPVEAEGKESTLKGQTERAPGNSGGQSTTDNLWAKDNDRRDNVRGSVEGSSATQNSTSSVTMELTLSSLPAPPKILSEVHRTSIGLPPTFSRLPPDGHEFPQTYSEPPTNNSATVGEQQLKSEQKQHMLDNQTSVGAMRTRREEAPPLPKSGPPTAGPRKVFRQNLVVDVNIEPSSNACKKLSASPIVDEKQIKKHTAMAPIKNGTHTPSGQSDIVSRKFEPPSKKPIGNRQCAWRKDEKSEKSVRDKIAMFSNETDAVDSPQHASLTTTSSARKMINRSVDNLLSDELASYRHNGDVDQSVYPMSKKAMSVENLDEKTHVSRYNSTYEKNSYREEYMLKAFSVENLTNDNYRADGAVTVTPKEEVRASIPLTYASLPRARPSLVARTTSFSGPSPSHEDRRRSAISNLLEQRKKSMSKLRGLVIPEKTAVADNGFGQVIVDLPEIKSKETSILPQAPSTMTRANTNSLKREPVVANYTRSFSNVAVSSDSGYTSIFTNSNSLRATVSTSSTIKRPIIQPLIMPPVKPPRTSLISTSRSPSDTPRGNGHLDDSDSDSVFSAKISSPPSSPIVKATPGKFALTRTLSSETNTSIASSTTSTLTSGSGSQASCSSLGSTPNVDMSRKISKSSSNDSYANRKNILALAKCRSGKDDTGPLGHRQRRAYEDEDSTDGYEEEEVMRHHAPKPKQRSLLTLSPKVQGTPYLPANQPINYRLVTSADTAVDMVINVASYVEVTSDTDGDSKHSDTSIFKINTKFIDEERRASFKAPIEEPKTKPRTPPRSPIVVSRPSAPKIEEKNNIKNKQNNTEMSQWFRGEVARSKNIEKPAPVAAKQLSVSRNILKFNQGSNLETPKTPQTTFTTTKVIAVKPSAKPEPLKSTTNKPSVDKSPEKQTKSSYHERFSSLDSLTSSSSSGISSSQTSSLLESSPTHMQSASHDFGSFSSFGSNHSLITPADLHLIIEEADPPLKRAEAVVVVMQRDSPECSVGVTLAGGADYETKEITIHRVLTNSPAYKDGRLRKGDRILSINGLSMRGLTHRESVAVLKTPRLEVVMVVTRSESIQPGDISPKAKESAINGNTESGDRRRQTYQKQSPTLHLDLDVVSNEGSYDESKSTCADSSASSLGDEVVYSINQEKLILPSANKIVTRGRVVEIFKDNCGLGLAIEGGLDSPSGHCPLTVKKVFMGGAAEKTGQVRPGDIIVAINDFNTEKVTRVQAWNFMKGLPCGSAKFHLSSS